MKHTTKPSRPRTAARWCSALTALALGACGTPVSTPDASPDVAPAPDAATSDALAPTDASALEAAPPDARTAPTILGMWTSSTSLQVSTLLFTGSESAGMVTHREQVTNESSGCVGLWTYQGTFTLAANMLTMNIASGTQETTMCRDSAQNRASSPLVDAADLSRGALDGTVTITADSLSIMDFTTRSYSRM